MGEVCYTLQDTFGLPPRRTHNADGAVRMRCRVPQKQGCDDEAFTALSTPSRRCELVLFEHLDKLFLVSKRLKAQDFFAEVNRVSAELSGFFQRSFFD